MAYSLIQKPEQSRGGAHRKESERLVSRLFARKSVRWILAASGVAIATGILAPNIIGDHGSTVPVNEQAMTSAHSIVSIINGAVQHNAAQAVFTDNGRQVEIGLNLRTNATGFVNFTLRSDKKIPTIGNQISPDFSEINQITEVIETPGGQLNAITLVRDGESWRFTGEGSADIAASEQMANHIAYIGGQRAQIQYAPQQSRPTQAPLTLA